VSTHHNSPLASCGTPQGLRKGPEMFSPPSPKNMAEIKPKLGDDIPKVEEKTGDVALGFIHR